MQKHFTLYILAAMAIGVLVGWLINTQVSDAETIKEISGYFTLVTDIFLRLIKMIIAPLVFATLVVGIAHLGDAGALGRIGAKTMGWFIAASVVSLSLGVLMVTILQPGVGLDLPLPDVGADSGVKTGALTLKDFITHLVPKSIAEAMANNEILQIVVFSVFVGVAAISLGERARLVVDLAEQVSQVMLKITGYVMLVAPAAVFAAIAATVASKGVSILISYGAFIVGFYASLGLLWVVLILAGLLVLGPSMLRLVGFIREPMLLAFSTASSEAAYPKTLDRLESFGVSRRISSFVLPLGYSFNLDGSMMYCTFATLFIAQAYGITLTPGQILSMLLLLMVTSKGMAGVPRASLVVIAATLSFFNIPEAGLLLILAVDHFLDMGRSATNVVGNSVATAVVAKWENELDRSASASPRPAGGEPAD
jgi:Na+/H+-dicarboxylate symporter